MLEQMKSEEEVQGRGEGGGRRYVGSWILCLLKPCPHLYLRKAIVFVRNILIGI